MSTRTCIQNPVLGNSSEMCLKDIDIWSLDRVLSLELGAVPPPMTLAMTLIALGVSRDYLCGLRLVLDLALALVALLGPWPALALALLDLLPLLRYGEDIGRPRLLEVHLRRSEKTMKFAQHLLHPTHVIVSHKTVEGVWERIEHNIHGVFPRERRAEPFQLLSVAHHL